jgi:hypothetical protein
MFATLDGLVPPGHPHRKVEEVVDLNAQSKPLTALYSPPELGERTFRMLVLQDVSGHEMERFFAREPCSQVLTFNP